MSGVMVGLPPSVAQKPSEGRAMRIYSRSGDIPFKTLTFPDGQPHIELLHVGEFRDCVIESPIRSPHELLLVLLAKDALTRCGKVVALDIRYLMGARLDRVMSARWPCTLEVVAQMIQAAGFRRIRVLDPHSEAALAHLGAERVMPALALRAVLEGLPSETLIIVPDAGATTRTEDLLQRTGLREHYRLIQCSKKRDSQSGALSGFEVSEPSLLRGRRCLIVDDICDGGGTFVGLAEELRASEATHISLFVTHGIFSKGPEALIGIDRIFTTDSFKDWHNHDLVTCFPISMRMADERGNA